MDRTFTYPGSLPVDTDILQPQRNIMVALGFALQAAFGANTYCDGLTCSPTGPASMSVVVGPGSIIFNTIVDQNAYGSISPDTTDALVKMGVNLSSTTIGPFTAPGTAGQSQNFLIQAAFSETDGGPTVLPYYNASNPSLPYSGPANSGSSQNTKRTQTVNLQVKVGTAATTGSQTTPAPDSGFVGLWVITIANGQSSITSGNIVAFAGAPFISNKMYKIPVRAGASYQTAGSFSWVCPNGVYRVKATVIGAGAAGGNAQSGAGAGGGGGGGIAIGYYDVIPGTAYSVVVGAGGTIGGSNNSSGNSGGTSSFASNLSATGGSGGVGASTGNMGGFGTFGSGTGGNLLNAGGSPGASGIAFGSTYYGGQGGASLMLSGPSWGSLGAGITGVAFGGGGGGGTNGNNGGVGSGGLVMIEY